MTQGFTIDSNALVTFWEVNIATGHLVGRPRPVASGFVFMQPDTIVTVKHVAEKLFDQSRPVVPIIGTEDRMGARVAMPLCYWLDAERDIAMIQYEANLCHVNHPLFPSHFGISKDPELLAIGLDVARSESFPPKITFTTHCIHEWIHQELQRSETEYWIEYKADWHKDGYSGAPLLDRRGGVVGVLTQTFTRSEDDHQIQYGRATSIYPAVDQFKFNGTKVSWIDK